MFLSILKDQEKEDFLNLIINVGQIDGDFTDKEKNQINAYVLEMGLELKNKDKYNKSNDELLENLSKSSNEVKRAVFTEIVALMLVDGMKDKENKFLTQMQDKFNLDSEFKDDVIKWYSEILPLYKKGFELVSKELSHELV